MVSEKEFHEILKEKNVVENCREIWWKHLNLHQHNDTDKELLKVFVEVVIKKGCKASCYL